MKKKIETPMKGKPLQTFFQMSEQKRNPKHNCSERPSPSFVHSKKGKNTRNVGSLIARKVELPFQFLTDFLFDSSASITVFSRFSQDKLCGILWQIATGVSSSLGPQTQKLYNIPTWSFKLPYQRWLPNKPGGVLRAV